MINNNNKRKKSEVRRNNNHVIPCDMSKYKNQNICKDTRRRQGRRRHRPARWHRFRVADRYVIFCAFWHTNIGARVISRVLSAGLISANERAIFTVSLRNADKLRRKRIGPDWRGRVRAWRSWRPTQTGTRAQFSAKLLSINLQRTIFSPFLPLPLSSSSFLLSFYIEYKKKNRYNVYITLVFVLFPPFYQFGFFFLSVRRFASGY